MNRGVEEGTFVLYHEGEVLNSKIEWRQPKIGAEMAGGKVANFHGDGNARGMSRAGRRIISCPGDGSGRQV